MEELRQMIENGDISVSYDGLTDVLHVYVSGRVLMDHAYIGTELDVYSPVYREIETLVEDGSLTQSEDGVVLIIDGEKVYTQFLIEVDKI